MWKLLNDKGSMLVESLTSLAVLSVVVIGVVSFFPLMFERVETMKMEVEGWRYFQDVVSIEPQPGSFSERTSDGCIMRWYSSGVKQSIVIQKGNRTEVLEVIRYE